MLALLDSVFAVLGSALAVLSLLAFCVVLIMFAYMPSNDKAYALAYQEFLAQHEGDYFFCYTDRQHSEKVIETYLLPALDHKAHIIKLHGRVPETTLDDRMISYALYRLDNIGFPNVMTVRDGKMIDHSIHHPIYAAINQKYYDQLPAIYEAGLNELKSQLPIRS